MNEYNPKEIEPRWQQYWLEKKMFAAEDDVPKKKQYILDMFPYPSGDGLHVGHVKIYTASDIVSRYLRMKGFAVLHPTGWDAFGLPTENSAIKYGIQPAVLTQRNVDRFRGQMQRLGLSYDWDREINTTDPEYYKWTQWIFLHMFRRGLAYEATIPINWCPKDKTGLANEEVIDGKCERCGTEVEQKPMRQWLLRITKYTDQLLEGLGGLDWPKFIKELQTNWIGKSEGAQITFNIKDSEKDLPVFTTRADTLYGVTYLVLSPTHPLVEEITTAEQKENVLKYVEEATKISKEDLSATDKDKTGVNTGAFAIHPLTKKEIPIWVADYVLMSYGAGAVMGVPAHDERDYLFATKYSLPIQQVVVPINAADQVTLPYLEDGVLMNSDRFDGKSTTDGKAAILQALQLQGKASKAVNYKLRDWVFSRQRYWGEPIPIIHCKKCGIVPVPEKDLPVRLPEVDKYEPTGTGESPLAAIEDWVNVKCPTCPNMAKRETNTMPQWAGSSWYWLRFMSPHFENALVDPEAMKKWSPVDVYVGGAEHAVLHLMYARFWHKVLFDSGIVNHNEPFKRFRAVGLVMGEDGQKMSKSRGNVINPDTVIEEFGADTLRVYEMFMGPFDASVAWDTHGIRGARRFLQRVWSMVNKFKDLPVASEQSKDITLELHRTIRKVSEATEQFKFNTAISGMMEFLNVLDKAETVNRKTLEVFVLLLAPYAPHIAEELWSILGYDNSLVYAPWPVEDEAILNAATVVVAVQVNGKVRGTITASPGLLQPAAETQAKELPNVQKFLEGVAVKKVIYVPDKLLNFVVGK